MHKIPSEAGILHRALAHQQIPESVDRNPGPVTAIQKLPNLHSVQSIAFSTSKVLLLPMICASTILTVIPNYKTNLIARFDLFMALPPYILDHTGHVLSLRLVS